MNKETKDNIIGAVYITLVLALVFWVAYKNFEQYSINQTNNYKHYYKGETK